MNGGVFSLTCYCIVTIFTLRQTSLELFLWLEFSQKTTLKFSAGIGLEDEQWTQTW
jgi:hypothetical protein